MRHVACPSPRRPPRRPRPGAKSDSSRCPGSFRQRPDPQPERPVTRDDATRRDTADHCSALSDAGGRSSSSDPNARRHGCASPNDDSTCDWRCSPRDDRRSDPGRFSFASCDARTCDHNARRHRCASPNDDSTRDWRRSSGDHGRGDPGRVSFAACDACSCSHNARRHRCPSPNDDDRPRDLTCDRGCSPGDDGRHEPGRFDLPANDARACGHDSSSCDHDISECQTLSVTGDRAADGSPGWGCNGAGRGRTGRAG
ncbi:MAG: hypothetical protein V4701_00200 [Pseudomonadota bacterium]